MDFNNDLNNYYQENTNNNFGNEQEYDETNYHLTLLLCFFLGWLGVHRFINGKIGTGILMFLTFGGCGVWILIDLIMILCGAFKNSKGQNVKVNKPFFKIWSNVVVIVLIILQVIVQVVVLVAYPYLIFNDFDYGYEEDWYEEDWYEEEWDDDEEDDYRNDRPSGEYDSESVSRNFQACVASEDFNLDENHYIKFFKENDYDIEEDDYLDSITATKKSGDYQFEAIYESGSDYGYCSFTLFGEGVGEYENVEVYEYDLYDSTNISVSFNSDDFSVEVGYDYDSDNISSLTVYDLESGDFVRNFDLKIYEISDSIYKLYKDEREKIFVPEMH